MKQVHSKHAGFGSRRNGVWPVAVGLEGVGGVTVAPGRERTTVTGVLRHLLS